MRSLERRWRIGDPLRAFLMNGGRFPRFGGAVRAISERRFPRRVGAALASLVVVGMGLAVLTGGAVAELTQSASVQSNFNGQKIPVGDTIWFQSVIQVHGGF